MEFDFHPDQEFGEWIDICRNSGVHRYKKAETRTYSDSYFLEEYKNQYKKTYFEDEANLRKLAGERLDWIGAHLPFKNSEGSSPRLLEIGSASGFFLDEAKKRGFSVQGIEISEEASQYGRSVLGLPIWTGGFLEFPEGRGRGLEQISGPGTGQGLDTWDVIVSFFTLEHIPDLEGIWKKLDRLSHSGTILVLALPSFFGPTFQTDPKAWFETHPPDHFFDYDPGSLKKVLNWIGFEMKLRKPLSFHPGRDKGWKGKLPLTGYRWISQLICYGDTFQILAQKK